MWVACRNFVFEIAKKSCDQSIQLVSHFRINFNELEFDSHPILSLCSENQTRRDLAKEIIPGSSPLFFREFNSSIIGIAFATIERRRPSVASKRGGMWESVCRMNRAGAAVGRAPTAESWPFSFQWAEKKRKFGRWRHLRAPAP